MGIRTKAAFAALVTAVVAFGVTAYAGALPRSAQNVAHSLIGAPAPGKHHGAKQRGNPHPNKHAKNHPNKHGKPAHRGTPVGPDATGPAAYGLCNAWKHSHRHGNAMGHSIAMRNLARAAGGAGRIASYCASIPRPAGSDAPEREAPDTEAPESEAPETDGSGAHS